VLHVNPRDDAARGVRLKPRDFGVGQERDVRVFERGIDGADLRIRLGLYETREAVARPAADALAPARVVLLQHHAERHVEGFHAQRGEVFGELLNARLVADSRVRERPRSPSLGRVFAAVAVDVIHRLGLRVVGFEVFVRDRPGGRDAVVVAHDAEILLAEPEQSRAVEFRVAADVVVRVRVQGLACAVVPGLFGVVLALDVDGARLPVVALARDVPPALQQQNPLARGREAVRESAAARAGADDDHVVVVR
jgi:hypothetical protein